MLALVQDISKRSHVDIFEDREKQKLTKTSEQIIYQVKMKTHLLQFFEQIKDKH